MVRNIIHWSLRNRLVVVLATLGLVGVGVHAALNLNVEAYPDPTPPLVEVITQNPGASPEEMERLIGIPLETALNGMPGLQYLRSTSTAGLNDIKCQFTYGTDYVRARQEVLNRITAVGLPDQAQPELSPWSPTGEIVRYVLEGPGYTLNQIKAVQDWVLNRELKTVSGVADVTGFGGTVKQYQVLLDPALMKQYGVTLDMVEGAIARSNSNVGGNQVALGTQSHTVRALGLLGGGIDPLEPTKVENSNTIEATKLEDISNVVITSIEGIPIYVRQVARVIVGHKPRLGLVGRDQEDDVVEGIVLMRKGEKSLPTAEAVADKFREIEENELLPKGMHIRVFNQRVDLVHVTTHNVLHNLLVGIALVVAVLFVFLGDLASAAIVAIVIPLALMFAITSVYYRGQSANLLSIGAVDFGIIVDGALIIVENIYRRLTEHGADHSLPIIDRVMAAADDVERPLFFSTLIIVCAFVPLFALDGPAGALFGPMAYTYAFSILGALLVATTLAPVLCSVLLKNKHEEKDTLVDRGLKAAYRVSLRWVLSHRIKAMVTLGALIAFTVALVPGLGGEFMPELEEGNLWIRATLPTTIALEDAARLAPKLRADIAKTPEIRAVMSHIGRPDDGTDVSGFFNMEFNVPLKPMELWREGMTREKIQDELMARFRNYPGVDFSFSQLIRDNVEEALSGVKGSNSVKLFGSDLAQLESTAQEVAGILRTIPGIENVGVFRVLGQPSLEVRIDRAACARYGINVADVETAVQVAIGGRAFSQMVEGEKTFEIVLRFPRDLRDNPEHIRRIPVDAPPEDGQPGRRIPLGLLAEIRPHESGASFIYRENNRRYVPIKFMVRGRDLASAIADARAKVEDPEKGAKIPRGYRIEWAGEFDQMTKANAKLAVMVPIAFVLILVLLYSMFGTLRDALLVLAGVSTAAMGGIWALRFTHTHFSISAAVGFISILGVVVQNGVLMISNYNQLRKEGYALHDAVMIGSERLVRPVVMISLTAILGLLPAALATSIGSQAQKPLAIVVVGGMLAAMFLSQYFLPVLYTIFPGPPREAKS